MADFRGRTLETIRIAAAVRVDEAGRNLLVRKGGTDCFVPAWLFVKAEELTRDCVLPLADGLTLLKVNNYSMNDPSKKCYSITMCE